jgi:hypothetical protein
VAALSSAEQVTLDVLKRNDGVTADVLTQALADNKVYTTEGEVILHLHRLIRFNLVTRETEPGAIRPTYRVNQ